MKQVKFDKLLVNAPVFLLGMPRSGTTWLSQIYESSPHVLLRLSPNYSYPLKNMLDEGSSRDDWIRQLTAALDTDDPFMTHNWRREKGELEWIDKDPTVVRQLVIKDTRFLDLYIEGMKLFPAAKCLYIVRHPCGHLNSWKKSPEFPENTDFRDHWRQGACRKCEGPGEYWGFDDWKTLTLRYMSLESEFPDRFKVFRYEELVANPCGVVRGLFEFAGVPFHEDVTAFLARSQASHNPSPYSVFRSPNVADSWRSEFPADIRDEIYAELTGIKLERFLHCA